MNDNLWKHIYRDAFFDKVDDIALGTISSSVIKYQFVLLLVKDTSSISDTFYGIHGHFNFSQFNTVAFVLYLEIFT